MMSLLMLAAGGVERRAFADPPPGQAAVPAPVLTPAQWIEDLEELARELPARHKNLFFRLSRREFESRVAALRERLPSLDTGGCVVEFRRLIAAVGDAHTTIEAGRLDAALRLYPLAAAALDDGFVIATAAGDARAHLGSHLLAVCGVPIEEAAERIATTYPWENRAAKLQRLPQALASADNLVALGICPSRDRASFTLRGASGEERTVEIESALPGDLAFEPAKISPEGFAAVSQSKRPEWCWFAEVPGKPMLYVRYERCADQKEKSVAAFTREIDERLDRGGVGRIIIDLRRNGGGNSALLDPWISRLARRAGFRARGSVVVLVGRGTFSSAQMNAASLREKCGAVVIGQPTGQKPNHFGEIRRFTLKHSGMEVWYSTKFFMTAPGDPESMMPDVEVPLLAADYLAGRDATMERAVEWEAER